VPKQSNDLYFEETQPKRRAFIILRWTEIHQSLGEHNTLYRNCVIEIL